MAAEGDACPRCEAGVLEVDAVEGFLLCPACGFVADDAVLVQRGGAILGTVFFEPGQDVFQRRNKAASLTPPP